MLDASYQPAGLLPVVSFYKRRIVGTSEARRKLIDESDMFYEFCDV